MEPSPPTITALTTTLQAKLSTALSSLIKEEVTVSLQHSEILPITDAERLVGAPSEKTVAVYIPLLGDVTGDIFLLLPEASAIRVADLMVGNPLNSTPVIDEFQSSAIQELGNILTGVVVTEIANAFQLSILLTVPNLATDMASALIDQVLISYGETAQEMLAFLFPFSVEKAQISGSFLLLFDQPTATKILPQATTNPPT